MALSRKPKSNGLSSVLVAAGGDKPDADAVRLACELLTPQKGTLYIAYVIEVERVLHLDAEVTPATARGEEILKDMENVAREHKCKAVAELLQSRQAGPAVVQEAVDKQVDAIVLGVPYGDLYGSFSIGEMAPYVLRMAPCRVILWRDLIPGTPTGNGLGA